MNIFPRKTRGTFNMKKLTVKDLTNIALMSAVMAICSWLTVPFTVPFTMQTFAIFFALKYLGGKKGTIAIVLYILLGAVGLPVFSGFTGGFGHLAGPTGGYILGFIASGIIFCIFESLTSERSVADFILQIVCLIACYALGTLWFTHVTGTAFFAALGVCVLPFIIPDVLKIVLANIVAGRLNKSRISKAD